MPPGEPALTYDAPPSASLPERRRGPIFEREFRRWFHEAEHLLPKKVRKYGSMIQSTDYGDILSAVGLRLQRAMEREDWDQHAEPQKLAYIGRCIYSAAMDFLEQKKRHGFFTSQADAVERLTDDHSASVEERLQEAQRARQLKEMIASLPEREGLVVRSRLLEGRTSAETAKLLGVTAGRVDQILYLARERLQERFAHLKEDL